ncbi:YndM family protein [Salirhabdus salicampi]|uniref:YndM family protein n=1 Tax=Salirhabdus salicampi TaxID=476102 RepID=UPI0020C3243F|nr:YndM family protein [Salirhabdus salicampi]MCP8615650.1 YndM family protein [Salirhabdus salicampi]
MRHFIALAIKFVSSLVLLWFILGGLYGLTFGNIFTIALVLGLVSYILGDLIILRLTNNTVATIADFGLALLVIWIMSEALTPIEGLFTQSLIAAAGLTIFEYFFHKYVHNNVLKNTGNGVDQPTGNLRYQVESAEELTDMHRHDDENK